MQKKRQAFAWSSVLQVESWKFWAWWNLTWRTSIFDSIARCFSSKPWPTRNRRSTSSWTISEVSIVWRWPQMIAALSVAMGVDPLAGTCKWLERAFDRQKTKTTVGAYQPATEAASSTSHTHLSEILNEAYCELLIWNPKHPFPEVSWIIDLVSHPHPRTSSSLQRRWNSMKFVTIKCT